MDKEEELPQMTSSCNTNNHRFKVQSVSTAIDYNCDSILDIPFDCAAESHSNTGSRYASLDELDNCGDDISIGNTSMFSQITADLISAPGNVLPWLSDPGSMLGSSILLASPSYLDVYQEVSSQKSGNGATLFDSLNEEDEDGDVFDNSEYIDTLEGRLPLAEAARMIAKDSSRHGSLFAASHIRQVRNDCYKRLLVIGFSFLLLFSSSFSIRNAMNSLGEDRQLSLICYGSLFSLVWFGGVCANPLMAKFRPKSILIFSTTGFIVYPLSMFRMAYYLTLPASVFSGFCLGLWWSTEGVYVVNTASTYSLVSGEQLIHVVSRFNGFVFCFYLSSHILGNLLSSLLLGDLYSLPAHLDTSLAITKQYNYSTNSTFYPIKLAEGINSTINQHMTNNTSTELICGLDYYADSDNSTSIDHVHVGKTYIYFAVNAMLPSIACLIIIVFLRPLKVAKRSGSGSLLKTLKLLMRTFADRRSLLFLPLLMGMGLMTSLIIADYNTSFISCAYGVDKLGYVIMTAFAFSAIGAFLSGRLVKVTGRAPVIIVTVLVSISSAVCLLLWAPTDTKMHPIAFVIPCLWALSEGVLATQANSFVAVMFKKRVAQAMTMMVTCLTMSTLFGTFGVALGIFTLEIKAYVAIGVNIVAVICYISLEILLMKNIL